MSTDPFEGAPDFVRDAITEILKAGGMSVEDLQVAQEEMDEIKTRDSYNAYSKLYLDTIQDALKRDEKQIHKTFERIFSELGYDVEALLSHLAETISLFQTQSLQHCSDEKITELLQMMAEMGVPDAERKAMMLTFIFAYRLGRGDLDTLKEKRESLGDDMLKGLKKNT